MNPTQAENANSGNSTWQITAPSDFDQANGRTPAIEGYASLTSVNVGKPITFYISAADPNAADPGTGNPQPVLLEIFRTGYYNDIGGRLMPGQQVQLSASYQQAPQPDADGLIDCNWNPSYTVTIPSDWASGVYVAKLTVRPGQSTSKQNYIIFVVREDGRRSDYLFQSSFTTFQTYNPWGGWGTYGGIHGTSVKVSFNRPYYEESTGNTVGASNFFKWDYNMVRWLEAEGYDVTYCTNIDVHENPLLLLSHHAFLSVGHDEYWTREMRLHVEQARDQGVHLAFFSGNTCYWQIRLEPSAVTGTPNRTIVSYKDRFRDDPKYNSQSDEDRYPYPNYTAHFQDVGWPENGLLGTSYVDETQDQNGYLTAYPLVITNPTHWVCANTGVVTNQVLTNVIGYEFNADLNDYDKTVSPDYWDDRVLLAARLARKIRPQGLTIIERSPTFGGIENPGRGRTKKWCDLTMYTAGSGAKVLSASTIEWSWGLDDFIVNGLAAVQGRNWTREPGQANDAIKQITRNVLNRFTVTQQGEGAFYQPDGQGGIRWRGGEIGWGSTWRMIVPGTFSTDGHTDLLFYDPLNGVGEFYQPNGQGGMTLIGSRQTGWRSTWSMIVPGKFSGGPYTDLLFYDPIRGEGEFYQSNGQGGITLIGSTQTGWRSTWRTIVPGKFSDGPYTDLLFYDPIRGEGEFYQPNGQGGMTLIGSTQTGWSTYWRTILPGNFSGGKYTDLLFYTPLDDTTVDYTAPINYTANNGVGEFYRSDGEGHIALLRRNTAWRSTWRMIMPGKFSGGPYTNLLFYDPIRGEGEFYQPDGQGGIAIMGSTQTGWRSTWQSIVVLDRFIGSPLPTGLLFYDQCSSTP